MWIHIVQAKHLLHSHESTRLPVTLLGNVIRVSDLPISDKAHAYVRNIGDDLFITRYSGSQSEHSQVRAGITEVSNVAEITHTLARARDYFC